MERNEEKDRETGTVCSYRSQHRDSREGTLEKINTELTAGHWFIHHRPPFPFAVDSLAIRRP